MEMTDFGNSYMTWVVDPDLTDTRKPGHMPWGNSARILLDARCTITDTTSGTSESYYLIAPCRTEWMYRDDQLIQNPSGEYRVIFSQDRELDVGIRPGRTMQPRSNTTERFLALDFTINTFPAATILSTDADVVAATRSNWPLNAFTELKGAGGRLQAVLEYPIKTMNIQVERQRFQVDTGPLIFADLDRAASEEHWIDGLSLAHTVYNTFDRADFVCRAPMPLVRDGREVATVIEYSEFHAVSARHTLVGAGR